MISGAVWLENYNRWKKGYDAINSAVLKIGVDNWWAKDYWGFFQIDPTKQREIAELDPAVNLALMKGQKLLAYPDWLVSPSDPDYKTVETEKEKLRADYDALVRLGNTTGYFARQLRIEDSHWTKTLGKHFLDRLQEVGEALEKGSDDLLEKLLKYLPFVIAGGVALILLNVASLVPKK